MDRDSTKWVWVGGNDNNWLKRVWLGGNEEDRLRYVLYICFLPLFITNDYSYKIMDRNSTKWVWVGSDEDTG